MADELIKRKELLRSIDRIGYKDWIRAAESLGFQVTQRTGGSSHYSIRKPGFEPNDFKGYIVNVYEKMPKQAKKNVFKKLRQEGIEEDAIWEALNVKLKV